MLTMTNNYNNAINASKRIIKAKAELFDVSALVATYTQKDAIKSINIERVGEDNKFFGIGVTHKTNIKLIDVNREINLTTDNYFKIQIGIELNDGSIEYVSFPKMYVTEVNRDENTNELSITAYDVLNKAKTAVINDLGLTKPYTIRNVLEAVGAKIGANNTVIKEINVLNYSNFIGRTHNGMTFTLLNDKNTIKVNGIATSDWASARIAKLSNKLKAGVYSFSVKSSNQKVNYGLWLYDENQNLIGTFAAFYEKTITITKDAYYYNVFINNIIIDNSYDAEFNIMLNEGPVVKPFDLFWFSIDTEYTDGANFEGTENLKDVLTAAAEATQTIYYIDSNDNLVYKRLDRDGEAVKTISKANYITLDSSTNRRLATICHATELGDNVSASKMEKSNKTINIDLGDNELCSIGDVKDELIVENGQAKIIKRIDKVVLNGTQNIGVINGKTYNVFCFDLGNLPVKNIGWELSGLLSNKGKEITRNNAWNHNGEGFAYGDPDSTYYKDLVFYCEETKKMTVEEFKIWLSNNNIQVNYILAMPEEIAFDISGYNLADGVYYGESTQTATPSLNNPSEIVSKETIDANILYAITGTTQYVRDNPFWELREDIAELLEDSKNAICGITINQFNCDWRGDLSLEPGDKIALVTKDDNTVISYLLNDAITYDGGLNQTSEWQYTDDEESESNPNNLGEALKQTFARVDKANKKIDLLVSEVDANNSAISSLQMSTDAINANVQKDINELTNKVNATMTAEDVKIEIQNELTNGVDKVTTKTGFTFDDAGLTVSKDGSEMTTTIDEDGMTVYRDHDEMLKANNEGVIAYNLHAKTYLIVGESSRFEDYEKDGETRTGCFWIGDTEV